MTSINKLFSIRRCIFQIYRTSAQCKLRSLHSTCSHNINNKSLLFCKTLQYPHNRTISCGPSLLAQDHTNEEANATKKLKQTGKLAKVFAEYGTTAVVFHTTISLTSLGISYMAVSSGIDVVALLQKFNLIKEVTTEATIAGGATTFVIAYACHKVFMPVRIFCTVTCTPLIVKRLRKLGLLKTPVKSN